jgi:hypothetical protein
LRSARAGVASTSPQITKSPNLDVMATPPIRAN